MTFRIAAAFFVAVAVWWGFAVYTHLRRAYFWKESGFFR